MKKKWIVRVEYPAFSRETAFNTKRRALDFAHAKIAADVKISVREARQPKPK